MDPVNRNPDPKLWNPKHLNVVGGRAKYINNPAKVPNKLYVNSLRFILKIYIINKFMVYKGDQILTIVS